MQAIEKEQAVDSAPASLCKEDSSPQESMRVKFEAAVRRAQDDICKAVSELDGKSFHEDSWIRPGGGGGVSRVLQVEWFLYTYLCTANVTACSMHLVIKQCRRASYRLQQVCMVMHNIPRQQPHST